MDWNLVLDYVRVLVWPGVAAGVIYGFRRQIKSWLNRLPDTLEVTPTSVKVGWQQASQPVARELEDDQILETLEEEGVEPLGDEDAGSYEDLLRRLGGVELALEFERIYNRIFGTQVTLLQALSASLNGWRRADMESYFQVAAAANPALRVWTVDTYLQFLIVNGLVERDGAEQYRATQKARMFLTYSETVGYVSGMRTL